MAILKPILLQTLNPHFTICTIHVIFFYLKIIWWNCMMIDQYLFTQFMELLIEFYILIDEYFD
jgi:hypothetical protein